LNKERIIYPHAHPLSRKNFDEGILKVRQKDIKLKNKRWQDRNIER
jgi:hypothetical protein